MITDDYLKAESLILAKLKTDITSITALNFRIVPDIAYCITDNPLHKSINVSLYSDNPTGDSANNGKIQPTEQIFLVIYSVRNVENPAESLHSDSGAMLLNILQSLQGAKIDSEFYPLHRTQTPVRKVYYNGFLHYPLAFKTVTTVKAV